jgi:hypothetical protein
MYHLQVEPCNYCKPLQRSLLPVQVALEVYLLNIQRTEYLTKIYVQWNIERNKALVLINWDQMLLVMAGQSRYP